MDAVNQFSCLGISLLGLCSYNPAQPASVYFSLGDGIAALGLTIAIQQFMKPIYQFRLRAAGIRLSYLFLCIFVGFACVIVAAILPNIGIPHRSFFSYPIVWELLSALIIAAAYGIVTFVSLRPVSVYDWNLLSFVRAAGHYLSKAEENDRAAFSEDLFHNLPKLLEYANAWDRAESRSAHLEFERLASIGARQSITGRVPIDPFYKFTHRRELERASYAGTLLTILSDSQFCAVLVRKCAWATASMIQEIGERHLRSDQLERFIHEVANQAISHEESLMAREIHYAGFGAVPLLTEALFGNWYVLRTYTPLQGLRVSIRGDISEGYVARLVKASELIVKTAIKAKDYWPQRYMYFVESAYENVLTNYSFRQSEGLSVNAITTLTFSISTLYELTVAGMSSIESDRELSLFQRSRDEHSDNLAHSVAKIAYECLTSVANSFEGPRDKNWTHATHVFRAIFPFHEREPIGVNPIQQRLALMLLEKLNENIKGWYPAISRVLLALIGPYSAHPGTGKRTAYAILRDGVYVVLKQLPVMHAAHPDKVIEFLPTNVTYEPGTNSLTHTYTGGSSDVTHLTELAIPEVDLFDGSNWLVKSDRTPANT